MQSKYYYLVSTLPYLKFGQEATVSGAWFLSECEKWLPPAEFELVRSAGLEYSERGAGDAEVLGAWREFSAGLKKELALARADKKGAEDRKISDRLRPVMEQENPLAMEKAFERIRWAFLDEQEAKYFFDLNFLILYFLKVQILERLALFNKDKGESYFYELCEVNYEQAIG